MSAEDLARGDHYGIDGTAVATEFLKNIEAGADEIEKASLLKKLARYKQEAATLVGSYIGLIEETRTDAEILQHLKTSAAGSTKGDAGAKSHVLLYYSQTEGGESTAQPHLRVPPLRNRGEHCRRFVSFGLQRSAAYDIMAGDAYVLVDAGRDGNKAMLLSSFVTPPEDPTQSGTKLKKTIRTMTLLQSEKSLHERLEKVRGHSSINQTQTLYVVSRLALSLNPPLGLKIAFFMMIMMFC